MLKLRFSKKFKKDLEKIRKRGMNTKKLDKVVAALMREEKLPRKNRDHALVDSRDYHGVRECHIEPDWLLIYCIENDTLTLVLMRTGTHSDLF